jgi:hypothetical protein
MQTGRQRPARPPQPTKDTTSDFDEARQDEVLTASSSGFSVRRLARENVVNGAQFLRRQSALKQREDVRGHVVIFMFHRSVLVFERLFHLHAQFGRRCVIREIAGRKPDRAANQVFDMVGEVTIIEAVKQRREVNDAIVLEPRSQISRHGAMDGFRFLIFDAHDVFLSWFLDDRDSVPRWSIVEAVAKLIAAIWRRHARECELTLRRSKRRSTLADQGQRRCVGNVVVSALAVVDAILAERRSATLQLRELRDQSLIVE